MVRRPAAVAEVLEGVAPSLGGDRYDQGTVKLVASACPAIVMPGSRIATVSDIGGALSMRMAGSSRAREGAAFAPTR
jgi:hypothetical protein